VERSHGSIYVEHGTRAYRIYQLLTHGSEVVPDIAETLTAWVVPAVRDRQSLTMHGIRNTGARLYKDKGCVPNRDEVVPR
jgi:hypothetical protein